MQRFLACFILAWSALPASAQTTDCDAIRNDAAPVQVRYHDTTGGTVAQVYKNKSLNDIVWTTDTRGTFRRKAVFDAGKLVSVETTRAVAGKYGSMKQSFSSDLPRLFNRRSNLQYGFTVSTTYGDGSTDESSTKITYTFKSEGTTTIGSCVFTVIYGETDGVNEKTGKTIHSASRYLPDLRLSLSDIGGGEPVVDDIETTFVPMTITP